MRSIVGSSSSGWRYMSSVLPRSERKVSETMSKAGMTGAPQVRGSPARPSPARDGVGREVAAPASDRRAGLEGLARGGAPRSRRPRSAGSRCSTEVERRHGHLLEAGQVARDAREDLAQREAVGVGQELVVFVGGHVLALDELKADVVGQVAARPAQLLDAEGFVAVGGEQGVGRHELPAELDGRVSDGGVVLRVVEARLFVRVALPEVGEVVDGVADHRHVVGLLEGDDVVEALLALLIELLACESRHDRSPVHRALKLRAAETSLPQPSAPV